MKTLSVTQAARNFGRVLEQVERDQEEILLVRDHRQVVRLVPEPHPQNALELLSDIYDVLDASTASALSQAIRRTRKGKNGRIASLRTVWDS